MKGTGVLSCKALSLRPWDLSLPWGRMLGRMPRVANPFFFGFPPKMGGCYNITPCSAIDCRASYCEILESSARRRGGCRSACSIGPLCDGHVRKRGPRSWRTKSAAGGHGRHPMMVHLHRFAPINKEEGILRWGLCPHAPGRPLSRFPLRGQAGAGRVPPTPQARAAPASSQSKRSSRASASLARPAQAAPPTRGAAAPLVHPPAGWSAKQKVICFHRRTARPAYT
jgi:hypothetical protein